LAESSNAESNLSSGFAGCSGSSSTAFAGVDLVLLLGGRRASASACAFACAA
jgi:hypothetical protein